MREKNDESLVMHNCKGGGVEINYLATGSVPLRWEDSVETDGEGLSYSSRTERRHEHCKNYE